jgi:hypothetical protein
MMLLLLLLWGLFGNPPPPPPTVLWLGKERMFAAVGEGCTERGFSMGLLLPLLFRPPSVPEALLLCELDSICRVE